MSKLKKIVSSKKGIEIIKNKMKILVFNSITFKIPMQQDEDSYW